MPIDNLTFTKTHIGQMRLNNFNDTTVVRLRVRNANFPTIPAKGGTDGGHQ